MFLKSATGDKRLLYANNSYLCEAVTETNTSWMLSCAPYEANTCLESDWT